MFIVNLSNDETFEAFDCNKAYGFVAKTFAYPTGSVEKLIGFKLRRILNISETNISLTQNIATGQTGIARCLLQAPKTSTPDPIAFLTITRENDKKQIGGFCQTFVNVLSGRDALCMKAHLEKSILQPKIWVIRYKE